MRGLASFGIALAFVAGCASTHGADFVHSCDEAARAAFPPGGGATSIRCDGLVGCFRCPYEFSCVNGALQVFEHVVPCDGGPPPDSSIDSAARDANVDAGVDAGPCAPHQPATGVGCRTSGECNPTRFEMCYAPGASPGCGPCVMARRTCATDSDCAATDYCESYVDPCTHVGLCGTGSDPTSTRCAPRCTATSCGAGFTCGTNGRCAAIPCVGGFACPTHTHCTDLPSSDPHGCARDACAFDADCGCGGACLTGYCYDTLGTCMTPAA